MFMGYRWIEQRSVEDGVRLNGQPVARRRKFFAAIA
jgi:hypothetical protein